ncbi:MAG: hypothetical protein J6V60_00045 [Muribaculaceae bacterium]|nr:hypothetical protein [Muribaculaceae bacterium]
MRKLMSIVFAGLLLGACNNGVNSSESDTVAIDTCVEKTEEQLLEERSSRDITLFGVETKCNPKAIVEDLSKAGIFKVDSIRCVKEDYVHHYQGNNTLAVDTIRYKNERMRSAIVEFAGVKFGLNVNYDKGCFMFAFISSVPIDQSFEPLKNTIMSYYGDTEDGDDDAFSCSWNTFSGDGPWIRIRPLHSDDGGTVMMWQRF